MELTAAEKNFVAAMREEQTRRDAELRLLMDQASEALETVRNRIGELRRKMASGGNAPTFRRRKGANFEAIRNYLETRPEGAAPTQIRDATGLPWSSVQAVLITKADYFEQADGIVRLRDITSSE